MTIQIILKKKVNLINYQEIPPSLFSTEVVLLSSFSTNDDELPLSTELAMQSQMVSPSLPIVETIKR